MSGGALGQFLGNEEVRAALRRALQNGSLPHAVLLTGPQGCGKNHLARCLAADYLFPQGGEGAAAVLRGESSEVLLIEGEGLSGQIKIDRVRQVRSEMFRTGLSAAGRAVLVRDAENMMAPAANALLKVLEEPPGEVLFILTAQDASALPATIRSRCAVYPLAELSLPACEEALLKKGADKTEAALLAAVYNGRLGLCLRVLENPSRKTVLNDALEAARAFSEKDRYALLCLFSRYEGRGDEEKEKRMNFLSDLSAILAAGLRESLPQAGLQARQAARLLPEVQKARQALQQNASAKLVFTALAVNLAR